MSTVEAMRDVGAEFPVLRREFDGQPVCYLDSAATSQTPQPVIDAMIRYYTECRASIHRGVYPLAVEATDLFEGARTRIAGVAGVDARGDDLHRQRHRGHQPGRLLVGPHQRRPGRSHRPDRNGASLQHRPLAAALPRAGGRARLHPCARRRSARHGRVRGLCSLAGPSWSVSSTSPTCSGRSTPCRRSSPVRTRRGQRCWSMAPRRSLRFPSISAPSTPISTPGPVTRPTARPGSASSTGGASCSRRCRPSSAAAT